MKKIIAFLLVFVMLFALSACGSSEPKVEITAETAVTSLQEKIPNVTSVVVYNEETDPNENLGRPGQYVGKADFFDNRMEDTEDNAGTIEFFSSESDCNDRYEYLCKFIVFPGRKDAPADTTSPSRGRGFRDADPATAPETGSGRADCDPFAPFAPFGSFGSPSGTTTGRNSSCARRCSGS